MSSSADQIYNAIKAQEINFPLPQPQPQLTVGTFNASTGIFSYATPTYQKIIQMEFPEEKPPYHNVTETGAIVPAMNAIQPISLRFNIVNRPASAAFSATVSSSNSSVTASAGEGENYVSVDIASLGSSVSFTLSCNGKEFTSQLPAVVNYALCGAGAFTIPAWPVSIVYAPPPDQKKSNQVKWKTSQSTGTTTVMTFTQASSGTQPVSPRFAWVNDFVTAIGVAKGVVGAVKGGASGGAGASAAGGAVAVVDTVVQALSVIASGLGSEDETETQGTSVNTQNSITVTESWQEEVDTNPGQGPGQGDVICYLQNARFCWLAINGQLTLTFLGADTNAFVSVADLQAQGANAGLDSATIQALLALDPFATGGSSATLPASRFVYVDTIEVGGVAYKGTESYTLSGQDTQQVAETTSTLDDQRAGWLSFLGIGVEDTLTLQSTLSQSSAVSTQTSVTISNEVDLNAQPGEFYAVEVYCDVVFGTFAFRGIPVLETAVFRGTLYDLQGMALRDSIVTLATEAGVYKTRTDASGQYSFFASTIKPQGAVLQSGTVRKELDPATIAVGKVDLRPEARM